jgi:serine/threonine protein kinase
LQSESIKPQTQSFFTKEDRKNICVQASEILKLLQQANVVHRDFRVHNLIYNPATKTLTLLDFGLLVEGKEKYQDSRNQCFRTYWKPESYWVPPEVKATKPECNENVVNFALDNPFSFDIFSLAVMILELAVHDNQGYHEMLRKIRTLDRKENELQKSEAHPDRVEFCLNNMAYKMIERYVDCKELKKVLNLDKDFLLRMAQDEATQRPNAEQIKNHLLREKEKK